jgi:hypothetical protein
VTVETMTVPGQPAAGRPAAGQSTAGDRPAPAVAPHDGPSVRRLWHRIAGRCALVPLTVLTPIVALAPTADHRFNIYWFGGKLRDDPLRIVPDTLHALPTYLKLGNFRPLGRMVERSIDLAAYTIGELTGLPVNVTFRALSILAAILLTLVAAVFAESVVARDRLFSRAPSTLAGLTPFAVGAGFVASGPLSPAVLFGGLYFASAALVLATAAIACRSVTAGEPAARRGGWWRALLLISAGAGLACFNEVTYFAVPLATAAVLIRGRWILELGWRRSVLGRGGRVAGLLWVGFLPVFVAVRGVIWGYCHRGGCYNNSDIALGSGVLTALPTRLVAWLPPVQWRPAVQDGHGSWLVGLVPLLALVILAVLARRAAKDLPLLAAVDRRQGLGLAAVAFVLLLLGAGMAALNGGVQDLVPRGRWEQGWRDTAVTAGAGMLVLLAAGHAVVASRRWRLPGVTVLVAVFALTGVLSTAANKRYRDDQAAEPSARLANRVAVEMADVDRSAAGDARRCALRQEFRTLYSTSPAALRRFDESLDAATRQRAGIPFCSAAVAK